jgi:hypothetical protein
VLDQRVPRLMAALALARGAVSELRAVQAEYATWLDSLPQATRSSPTAEALQTIVDLDLDELSAIEPPRGFGRD